MESEEEKAKGKEKPNENNSPDDHSVNEGSNNMEEDLPENENKSLKKEEQDVIEKEEKVEEEGEEVVKVKEEKVEEEGEEVVKVKEEKVEEEGEEVVKVKEEKVVKVKEEKVEEEEKVEKEGEEEKVEKEGEEMVEVKEEYGEINIEKKKESEEEITNGLSRSNEELVKSKENVLKKNVLQEILSVSQSTFGSKIPQVKSLPILSSENPTMLLVTEDEEDVTIRAGGSDLMDILLMEGLGLTDEKEYQDLSVKEDSLSPLVLDPNLSSDSIKGMIVRYSCVCHMTVTCVGMTSSESLDGSEPYSLLDLYQGIV